MSVKRLNLTVHRASVDDVFRDTIRVSESDRGDLKPGRVHRFKIGKKVTYAILRGMDPERPGQIRMDEALRLRLGVGDGESRTVVVSSVGAWGQLRWAWAASDPAYAIAARLGVLSLFLGIVSVRSDLEALFRWLSGLLLWWQVR